MGHIIAIRPTFLGFLFVIKFLADYAVVMDRTARPVIQLWDVSRVGRSISDDAMAAAHVTHVVYSLGVAVDDSEVQQRSQSLGLISEPKLIGHSLQVGRLVAFNLDTNLNDVLSRQSPLPDKSLLASVIRMDSLMNSQTIKAGENKPTRLWSLQKF